MGEVTSNSAEAETHQAVLGPDDFEDDREIIAEFVNDASEHLSESESRLQRLDDNPRDADALGGLFRGFHTIKGLAGFLGFGGVEALAHSAEDLLSDSRGGDVAMPSGATGLILESVDHLSRAVDDIRDALASGADMPRPAELAPELVLAIRALRDLPAAAPAGADDRGAGTAEQVGTAVATEAGGDTGGSAAGGDGGSGDGPADAADRGNRQESIRVDAERLDRLVDVIGELVICESMFRRAADLARARARRGDFNRHLDRMDKITRDLQETAGSLRMVPVRATFRKMSRVARDVARRSGCNVRFSLEGEETELDKGIVERIADPLVHMVRNAIDHGIERDPGARTDAGKPAQGQVTLRAFHHGGSIRIEVEDDGQGLHTDRIRNRAIECGVIAEGDVLSEPQMLQLLCAPGFSTAPEVTAISGRGVGMDVVRQHVEAMGGTLDIRSQAGLGSCFSISLPLTLAVIDGMVLRIGTERYVVPTLNVVRLVQPDPERSHSAFDRGELIHADGALVPVLDPQELLGVEATGEDGAVTAILEANGVHVALPVDAVLGQQQLVIKHLGEGLGDLPGIGGCTIMSDGLVGLVLDTAALIRNAQQLGAPGLDVAAAVSTDANANANAA